MHAGGANRALKVLIAWKYLASDPLHHYLSPQGCPTHSMAIKHIKGNVERWKLKKVCKIGAFQGCFCSHLGQKEDH